MNYAIYYREGAKRLPRRAVFKTNLDSARKAARKKVERFNAQPGLPANRVVKIVRVVRLT